MSFPKAEDREADARGPFSPAAPSASRGLSGRHGQVVPLSPTRGAMLGFGRGSALLYDLIKQIMIFIDLTI